MQEGGNKQETSGTQRRKSVEMVVLFGCTLFSVGAYSSADSSSTLIYSSDTQQILWPDAVLGYGEDKRHSLPVHVQTPAFRV